jgi:hypothetical protein
MRTAADRKRVIRIAGIAVSLAGLAVGAAALLRFVRSVEDNTLAGGPVLTHIPEYYRQVGAYYARGFTTGFFVCYFLMLFAMIVGSWVDEFRRARRSARAAEAAPAVPGASASPALAGGAATRE